MPDQTMTSEEMLRRLVAFDTTSALSNLALIDFVRDYLDGHGIASHLTFDDDGKKANLLATIGPAVAGGYVLSGHTDVVPVEGQPWDSDPFTLTERGDRLHARGTCDMKGFIAIALALVPEFKAAATKLPIHLAFTYDEEVGCYGVKRLIPQLMAELPRPSLVIVGEPTEMKVANAHKGVHSYVTTVTGKDAHSSQPQIACSAIEYAAEIVRFIYAMAHELRDNADPASLFVPPYTTFNIGTISGGTAGNIIPRQCRFGWNFRGVPTDDPAELKARFDRFVEGEILPRMRREFAGAAVETQEINVLPALAPEERSPAEEMAKSLTGANGTVVVSFGTEAGHFQRAGLPAVVCGPGSIMEAHQPNEFITREQLRAGETFQRRLLERAAA
ncbi:MAG: acetylornithine deacetylase [Alphaproteobacteria bacterium]